jgi:hypothetical protein
MGKVVRNMEKVFATRCLDVGRNMLATSSQHVRHKLVTSLATCTLCQGRRVGAQHGKSVRNMGKGIRYMEKGVRNMGKCVRNMRKGVRNIRNTLRNIMIRRLICFLIRIMWLRRCPILAPGSDVRVLAVPIFFHNANRDQ